MLFLVNNVHGHYNQVFHERGPARPAFQVGMGTGATLAYTIIRQRKQARMEATVVGKVLPNRLV